MAKLLQEPAFWIDLAFFAFVALAFWKGRHAVKAMLDEKIQTIQAEIESAVEVRERAEKNLLEVQEKESILEQSTQELIDSAEKNAQHIIRKTEEDWERQKELKQLHTQQRVAYAENEVVENFRRQISAMAIKVATIAIKDHIDGQSEDMLVDKAIEEIEGKISAF